MAGYGGTVRAGAGGDARDGYGTVVMREEGKKLQGVQCRQEDAKLMLNCKPFYLG